MSAKEYFGEWTKVIDVKQAEAVMRRLIPLKGSLCPAFNDVFKCFRLCPLPSLRCVIMGQDPYPQFRKGKPIATGLAFANPSSTLEQYYSPSLEVLKESVINFSMPHNFRIFDVSLESWEKQGVLLLNTALTCRVNHPSSHCLLWKPFTSTLLHNLSNYMNGIVYVLMGSVAQSMEPHIGGDNHIIKCPHPAYYARVHQSMPSSVWKEINDILIAQNGYGIEWYNEL